MFALFSQIAFESVELDSDSLKRRLRERDEEFRIFADFARRVRDAFPRSGASNKS